VSRIGIALALAAGALAAGCGPEGSYRLTWEFAVGDVREPAATGCGAHGVDGIRITGGNTEGEGEDVVALCSRGEIVRGRPVGRWSLVVHQLDARGAQINVPDKSVEDVVIEEDALTDGLPVVVLDVRPECDDDVDNDRDGRVDIDDPECTADPAGPE
jgi:hypothetical protein